MEGLGIPGVVVLGTDTEVGKTFQACRLATHLSKRVRIGVYKPVASGSSLSQAGDGQLLASAAGCLELLPHVCPQQFSAAVAPPVAARLENRMVDEALLFAGARWWVERCEFLIVEGAGGVLSPISDCLTCRELAEGLQLPILLVAANRLGVVNHTLLSLEALTQRGLEVAALVLNDLPASHGDDQPTDLSRETNRELLQQFCGLPILADAAEWEPPVLRA